MKLQSGVVKFETAVPPPPRCLFHPSPSFPLLPPTTLFAFPSHIASLFCHVFKPTRFPSHPSIFSDPLFVTMANPTPQNPMGVECVSDFLRLPRGHTALIEVGYTGVPTKDLQPLPI